MYALELDSGGEQCIMGVCIVAGGGRGLPLQIATTFLEAEPLSLLGRY